MAYVESVTALRELMGTKDRQEMDEADEEEMGQSNEEKADQYEAEPEECRERREQEEADEEADGEGADDACKLILRLTGELDRNLRSTRPCRTRSSK